MNEVAQSFSETSVANAKTIIDDTIDASFKVGVLEKPTTLRADIIMNVVASRAAGGTKKYDFQTTLHAYNASAVNTTLKTNIAAMLTEWEDTITDSGMYNTVSTVEGSITIRPDDLVATQFTKTWGGNSADDYGGVWDCLMYKHNPDVGYDGVYIAVGCGNAATKINRTIIGFDIKSDLDGEGATEIVSATMYIKGFTTAGSHTVSAYRLFQYTGGTCTWNTPWNTSGCEAASDSGEDDGVYDRKATPEDSDSTHTLESYSTILDLTSLAQEWLAGTASEYGVLLQSDNEAVNNWLRWYQTEDADGSRPYLEIVYNI